VAVNRRNDSSTRPKFAKNHVRVDEATGLHIGFGLPQGFVQRGAIFVIEPISGIERQQFYFCAFREIGGFVNNETSSLNASLQRHRKFSGAEVPANAIAARTSSSVNVGKSARISAVVAPSARLARTVFSVTRVPFRPAPLERSEGLG